MNIQLDKLTRDIVSYSEVNKIFFAQIIIVLQQVIQSNFAIEAKCNYFFKAKVKL
ncbi:MAG: hypothetical protein ACJA0E_000911 [Bermanella sp.]|jgi:hypothetical protein